MTTRPFVIGVTGNIACGKSLVLATLADLGAQTIDADTVYHGLIAPGAALLMALRERFGPEIIAADGTLDRRALGQVVFSDPEALAALDALTHPAVIAAIQARIAESRADVLAIDAVKLIESGLDRDCDAVWIVTCDPEQSIARLMARNGFPRADAVARVAAQPEITPRFTRADVVIDNSGSRESTVRQVERAWRNREVLDTSEKIV